MLNEVYLRRTKEGVLLDDLPTKEERIVFCEPSQLQKELYQHIISQPDFVLLAQANAPCDCGVNKKVKLLLHRKALRENNRTTVSKFTPIALFLAFAVFPGVSAQTKQGGTNRLSTREPLEDH